MSTKYILRLYIMGQTPNSQRAITNLKQICEDRLKGLYSLQIVDLSTNIQLAEDERIFATPLLEKRLPPPIKRIIGDLADVEKVLFGADLVVKKIAK